jgi:nicotinamide riboside kinase
MKPTKHISIFGAPGSGKSTTSAGVFYEMKKKSYKVELVDEYAKELTYSKDFLTLSDQAMVFARQRHKMEKLEGQVDYTVNDASFLLSSIFSEFSNLNHLPKASFDALVIETYKMYDTLNIFLESDVEYQDYGRNETKEEALVVGEKIKKVLTENGIPYTEIEVGENTVKDILKLI